ncbi:MAG: hypothetical protein HYX41_05500 [Bdellovibrio sp.]|nr:hypothetical protein [Bdellovibrio sp.]
MRSFDGFRQRLARSLSARGLVAALLVAICTHGCSTVNGIFGPGKEAPKPISNPFADYRPASRAETGQNIVLRTKKGDRSVEVELPADTEQMSDFVLPVSPAFKEGRTPATGANQSGEDSLDETYKDRAPSMADREITSGFPQSVSENGGRRQSIEQSLNLAESSEDTNTEKSGSYLAGLDRIKQLFRLSRYEAALLETDEMLKLYQTDAKLHEMRGTLLDRMGRRELALKSWNQALRFDPTNAGLRRFIQRKEVATKAVAQ